MTFITTTDSSQDVELIGKSGHTYQAKIYEDKHSSSDIRSSAIVCLANSYFDNGNWHHDIRDIYDTDNIEQTLHHFRERDDISHLLLIPRPAGVTADWDWIDDLRRNYIHK